MNRKKFQRQRSESPMQNKSSSEHLGSKDSEDNLFDDLANLVSEINLKQKLTEELELSQRRLSNLQQHYEDKLQQLQITIKSTQEERNTVLSSLRSNNNLSGISKKVQDDYERKLNSLQKELKSLHSAKEKHAKHLRDQSQCEDQPQTLKFEGNDKKQIKVKSADFYKTKEETTKQDSINAGVRIINLESQSRALDAIFKKNQEVTREETHVAKPIFNIRKDAAGNYAYQKNSKQTWINLEKEISALTLNKQTLYYFKKDMERLLQEQEKQRLDLDYKKKLAQAQDQNPHDDNFHNDFEEEIMVVKANLDCVNETIKELQESILQLEDSKTVSERLELNDRVHNLPEAIYVMEKLVQMYLDNLCLTTQTDIQVKELETKMQQMEKENEIQKQLIKHMLSSQESPNKMSTKVASNERTRIRSVLSSTSSSGSISRSDMKSSSPSKNDSKKNKHKQKAAPTQEAKNNDKHLSRISRIRVSGLSSLLRRDKCNSTPSPLMTRKKIERQVSMVPCLKKESTFVIIPSTNLPGCKPGLKIDERLTIPKSTPPRRRMYGVDENSSSRQSFSRNQSIEQPCGKGIIQPYQGKMSLKAPLICTHTTEGHSKAVLSIFATDDLLFSASIDKTVKIWDLNTGKEIRTLGGHPNNVVAVKYDESSQLVFSASSSYVRVWDMRLSKSIKTLSSSGIVNNGSVMSSPIPIGEIQLNDIALNNYGRTLYTATGDKVKIWDLRKFTVRGKLCSGLQSADVNCLAIGRFNGNDVVVTGSNDNSIRLFEVDEEAAGTYNPAVSLEPPHYGGIQALALRDEMLYSGSRDYAINQWDLDKQELTTSINNAHSDWVCGLAVVPGQPLLLSVCRSGCLKIWSDSSCSLLGEIEAHDCPINAIATNSTHVFTAAQDGTMKLWQVKYNLDTMA